MELSNYTKTATTLNIVVLNLFDRLYGEEVTQFSAVAPWKASSGDWISKTSGVLSDEKQVASADGYLGVRGARVVDLLSPTGRLFEALLRMNWHFQMSIGLLPEKAQMKLVASKEYQFVASKHHLLYDNLLKLQNQTKVSSFFIFPRPIG